MNLVGRLSVALACVLTGCSPPADPTLAAAMSAASVILDGKVTLNGAPLANALVFLSDPLDKAYRFGGRPVTTTTDDQGRYRMASGVPRQQPVIVGAMVDENRRLTAYLVPESGLNKADLSAASTVVTEFLRHGVKEGTLADTPAAIYGDLVAATGRTLESGALAPPDTRVDHVIDQRQAYALVIGQDFEGLGGTWAKALGRRTLATTVLAGRSTPGDSGDGGRAKDAGFLRPVGLVVDRDGTVYVADEAAHRVRRIGKNGQIDTHAGTGERGFSGDDGAANDAQLDTPVGVAFDIQRDLVIFDSRNARLRVVSQAKGLITTIAGLPAERTGGLWEQAHAGDGGAAPLAKLALPRAGVVDTQGNLYVSEGIPNVSNHVIRRISTSGVITTFAGRPEQVGGFGGENVLADTARFNMPGQLAITPDDILYVVDTQNHCVRKIDLITELVRTVAGRGGQRAASREQDGKLATETRLNEPVGVAVDAKGQVFISERGFGRLMVVKPDGKLYTLAGGGMETGEGDAAELSLPEPGGLALEPDGNLLLADTRGARVRRFLVKFGL